MEDDFFDLIHKMIEERRSPIPSKNEIDYWVTHYTDNDYPSHTDLGGKWLLFCSEAEIDSVWEKIKKAQDADLLGNASKSSTVFGKKDRDKYVICVYTYDSSDEEDVLRVRESLRDLGFDKPLHYKRDIETINRVYGSDNEFLLTI